MSIKAIITHPGAAHRDDLLAVALLLDTYPSAPVYRRNPTPEELVDPEILVVDVGGQHEPALGNFDHHQLPREAPPTCALTLVLAHLGLLEAAREAWPWLADTEELDSKGPFTWAASHLVYKPKEARIVGCGMEITVPPQYLPWATVQGIASSPVEGWLLKWFSGEHEIRRLSDAHELLGEGGTQELPGLGAYLHQQLTDFADRLKLLDAGAHVRRVPLQGKYDPAKPYVDYVDATCVPRGEQPAFALEAWCKRHAPQAAVTITRDDRGDGLCLFRRNDDPRVDFSRCKNLPGVIFAHANGFVCKLAAGVDFLPVLRQAVVGVDVAEVGARR